MYRHLSTVRGFAASALLACAFVVSGGVSLAPAPASAHFHNKSPSGGKDLLSYGDSVTKKLTALVKVFRTILFFVLVIGLLWFVAMFVSGRPAIKPVITCVVAAVMLGGVQVILNTFVKVEEDEGLKDSPADMLQY